MKKDPVDEALDEAQISAVRQTVKYLYDTLVTANEVGDPEEKRTVNKVLDILGAIAERPDMILGPDTTEAVFQEKKYAASILMAMCAILGERGDLMKKSVEASAEMGFNMLSQQGMIAALSWVQKLCLENARGLDPDLKVDFVSPDSAEGQDLLNKVRDVKSVDEELQEALGGE